MRYENTHYWTEIHRSHDGQLKAVGYPLLSEAFNVLKYQSEAQSVLEMLPEIVATFSRNSEKSISILDIGAGIGYWTSLIKKTLAAQGFNTHNTALDISAEALAKVREMDSSVEIFQADLKIISPEHFKQKFDLVYAFYCLHHLKRHYDFLNALRFAAASVKKGGYLILMDPMLRLPFSLAYSIDFATYAGNGVMRPLYLLDDILHNQGLQRCKQKPAVSFLLNGNAEAFGFFGYVFLKIVWKTLGFFLYRSERLTKTFAPLLIGLDRLLKKTNLSFSSVLFLYQQP